jgi:hypothetical protein
MALIHHKPLLFQGLAIVHTPLFIHHSSVDFMNEVQEYQPKCIDKAVPECTEGHAANAAGICVPCGDAHQLCCTVGAKCDRVRAGL